MPLSRIFISCFRSPNDAAVVAQASNQSSISNAPSQGCGAPAVLATSSVAGRPGLPACALKGTDASLPLERSITSTRDAVHRPSFCVELRQPSAQHPEQRSKVEYTTADQLVKDVQDLRWLGQGAQGVVYEGTWQGATVAVKFSIVENLDATAYELLFSRLLSHPNVVQTFVAKVALLDERTIHPTPEGCGEDATAEAGAAAVGGGGGAGVGGNEPPGCSEAELKRPAGGAATAAVSALYRPGRAGTHAPCDGAAATSASGTIPAIIARCGGGSSTAAAAADAASSDLVVHAHRAGGAAAAATSAASCEEPPLASGGLSRSHAHHHHHHHHHRHHTHHLHNQFQQNSNSSHHHNSGSFRHHLSSQLQPSGRADSFQSDDGFGDPFGRRSTFSDVREVLATMGARPGHFITQMVMEHCDHGSLHAAIQRGIFKPTSRWGPKLALRALIRTVREVAQGMFHLHSNNVLHGDLKPANVLLINSRKDRRGYVAKVSDFGMAQFCPQDHISNAPWGTLVYMAPERLLQGQLFPASDVYSFGVILWEMYHGQRPYEGMHAAQIVMACAQGSASLEWSPDACPDVVRISRTCMAPSPRDRPSFAWLMHELALLESRVRSDSSLHGGSAAGAGQGRGSRSMDAGSRPVGRLSVDAVAPQIHRARTVSGMHAALQRASLDCASPASPTSPVSTAAVGAATAAAAAAAAAAAPSRHLCSKEFAAAGAANPPGGRLSVGVPCRVVSHARLAAVQTPPPPFPRSDLAPIAAASSSPGPSGVAVGLQGGGALGAGSFVTAADMEAGRRSGGSSAAAAIAAALAQQPGLASAVVSELLALRLQQQQQQQQPQQAQQQGQEQLASATSAEQQQQQQQQDTEVWAAAAAATASSRHVCCGDGGGTAATAPRNSTSGGDGSTVSGLWRRSSGGLAAAASAALPPAPLPPQQQQQLPPSQSSQPATPTGCDPSRPAGCSLSPSCGGSQRTSCELSQVLPPPQRSGSCGCGAAAAGSGSRGGGAVVRSGSSPMTAADGGGSDAGGSGSVAEAAAAALLSTWPSSPGRQLAAPLDDGPFFAAADAIRDAIRLQRQQQQQPAAQAQPAAAAKPPVRRRNSSSAVARRSSNSKGWECPTITEEPPQQ